MTTTIDKPRTTPKLKRAAAAAPALALIGGTLAFGVDQSGVVTEEAPAEAAGCSGTAPINMPIAFGVLSDHMLWPITSTVGNEVGCREHPNGTGLKYHHGQDFGAGTGTAVYASDDGTVAYSGSTSCVGGSVWVDHETSDSNVWQTRYLHIVPSVGNGASVERGEQIGTVENLGADTACWFGPHLHFEIRYNGAPVDWDNHFSGSTAVTARQPLQGQRFRALTIPECNGEPATHHLSIADDWANGTSGRDVFVGRSGNDLLNGLSGDDIICGNGGNDALIGGPGIDQLRAAHGNDTCQGKNGVDSFNSCETIIEENV